MSNDFLLEMRGFVIYLVLALSPVAYAFPYNVRDAFCKDKLSRHNSNYTNANIYNHCMSNADRLIREYENERIRRKIEWEKGEPERRRQREKMERERKQQELEAKRREQQRKAEEYKKKLEEENEKRRIDNLFKTKFD